ncbi:hypothetical protein [Phormidesmis sp. 146-33]
MLYKPALEKIYVCLTSRILQETLAAYWQNTESAVLSTLEYATGLHARDDDFKDVWHSTNSLGDALRIKWIPIQPRYRLPNFNQYCRQYKPIWKQHLVETSRSGSRNDEFYD